MFYLSLNWGQTNPVLATEDNVIGTQVKTCLDFQRQSQDRDKVGTETRQGLSLLIGTGPSIPRSPQSDPSHSRVWMSPASTDPTLSLQPAYTPLPPPLLNSMEGCDNSSEIDLTSEGHTIKHHGVLWSSSRFSNWKTPKLYYEITFKNLWNFVNMVDGNLQM